MDSKTYFYLEHILQPGTHLYYVTGNKFSIDFRDAWLFTDREYAQAVVKSFKNTIDLQLKSIVKEGV